jgi:hypothetical protein
VERELKVVYGVAGLATAVLVIWILILRADVARAQSDNHALNVSLDAALNANKANDEVMRRLVEHYEANRAEYAQMLEMERKARNAAMKLVGELEAAKAAPPLAVGEALECRAVEDAILKELQNASN